MGILLGSGGDGCYYCMVNQDESLPSDVLRNKAMQGVETVGSVSGGGFELFERFTACAEREYYGIR